jgi:transcriptional regulator with XRE-family HTH domain
MTPPSESFAARLRALRLAAGPSVARLAALSGLNRQALYRLERGDREPSWETVRRLADALGVTPDAFLPPAPVDNHAPPPP